MATKKYFIGILLLVILASSIYIAIPDKVKIQIDVSKTVFSIFENGKWLVSGNEYNSIYAGSKKVAVDSQYDKIYNITNGSSVKLIRERRYVSGTYVIDTYEFDGNTADVTLFPISHKIEILNGSGEFFRYEVKNLYYSGETIKSITANSMAFGKNMRVEWQVEDKKWAKLTKLVGGKGNLAVQYDIPTDYEVYNVRLFDPPVILYSTNSTSLSFITTLTAQSHFVTIFNTSSLNYANLTSTYSGLSVGGWDVYLNGARLGNISMSDSSPKTFVIGVLGNLTTINNITYVPNVLTTGTITQTSIAYEYNVSAPQISFISPTPVNGTTVLLNSSYLAIDMNVPYNLTNTTFNIDNVEYKLMNGLVAYYNLNNITGENSTNQKSFIGSERNGTLGNGALICDGFSGKGICFDGSNSSAGGRYFNFENPINNMTNYSISLWVKPYSYAHDDVSEILKWNFNRITFSKGANEIGFNLYNGTTDKNIKSVVSIGEWHHVTAVRNDNNFYLYIDGIQVGSSTTFGSSTDSTIQVGSRGTSFPQYTNLVLNGTVDEIRIYNRTLSEQEALGFYNLLIERKNTTSYNATIKSFGYNMQLKNFNVTIYDAFGNSNTTGVRTLYFNFLITLSANLSQKLLTVNETFYGAGLQGAKLVTGNIDKNCDGVFETARNISWQQSTYKKGGFTTSYYDASLDGYYNGIENPSFEYWINSTEKYINASSTDRIYGWAVSQITGAEGWISRSVDAHEGSYSMNITGNKSTHFYVVNFFEGTQTIRTENNSNYTASYWIKGNGTFSMRFRYTAQSGTPTCGSSIAKTINFTDGWQQINLSCNVSIGNLTNTLDVIVLDGVGPNETVLIDDFSMTRNGQPFNWWYNGDTSGMESQLDWDLQNGVKSMLIMDYTPRFQALRDGTCIDNESDSDFSDCKPSNNTVWAEISVDWYKRVDKGRNITRIQLWNEPDTGFWEDNLGGSTAKTNYSIFFNDTYNYWFNYNPNIQIWGYRGLSDSSNGAGLSAFARMMISNHPDKFKYFSYHPYDNRGYINANKVSAEITYFKTQCALYGAECTYYSLDEWHPNRDTRNLSNGTTPLYHAEVAYFIVDLLNTYANVTSQYFFHWDDSVSYFNCPSRYSEYPAFWSSISEAGLDNPNQTYYPGYNINANSSRYANGDVYNYSINSQDAAGVVSVKNDSLNIMIVNIRNYSINVSFGCDTFRDNLISVDAQSVLDCSTENVNLGRLTSYQVMWWTKPKKVYNESIGLNLSNYQNEQIQFSQRINLTSTQTVGSTIIKSYASDVRLVNASIQLNFSCSRLTNFAWKPKNGNIIYPNYSCVNDKIYFNGDFNISNSSNEATAYYCAPVQGENWIIDGVECTTNETIYNPNKWIYLTNGANLTINSNISIWRIGICNGCSLIKTNGNYITLSYNYFDSLLQAWYRLEQGNGTFFVDQNSRFNGTCAVTACPAFNSSGKYGGAYTFDGVNDSLDLGLAGPNMTVGSQLTVNAWVKVPSNPTGNVVIVGVRNGSATGDLWKLGANQTAWRFEFDTTGSGGAVGGGTFNVGNWTMLTGVYNGSDILFYFNGVFNTSLTRASARIDQRLMAIGKRADSPGEYFNGSIDEVMVVNRTFSSTEISDLYSSYG